MSESSKQMEMEKKIIKYTYIIETKDKEISTLTDELQKLKNTLPNTVVKFFLGKSKT